MGFLEKFDIYYTESSDISPANVMIKTFDDVNVVKVCVIILSGNLFYLMKRKVYLINKYIYTQSLRIIRNLYDENASLYFRLEYTRLNRVIQKMFKTVQVLGTTATANKYVIEDLKAQFGGDVFVSRGELIRHSLSIQILRLSTPAERYAWILQNVSKLQGSGIIYCLTQRDCEYLADFLLKNGITSKCIESYVNIRKNHIDKTLMFLENEESIYKEKTKCYPTFNQFHYNKEHYDKITAVQNGQLLLFSAVKPDMDFTAETAMMRNKYIYVQSAGTVFVRSDYKKGGKRHDQDKNIDRQTENKFNAFKAYTEQHNLHWRFVHAVTHKFK
ncbi:MAG: hypothetical protein K2K16_09925 [Ruminococcus sp.]|nr:hypothetical protein [Ruminococcus sp.]